MIFGTRWHLAIPPLAAIAWPESLGYVSEAAKWLIAVAGGIAILAAATKRGRALARAWWERRAVAAAMPGNVARLVTQVAGVSVRIEKIEREALPNGGSSMNDRLNAIYRMVKIGDARSLAFQDRTDTAVYECGPNGETLVVNRALCEIFGMTHEEMMADNGTGWLSAIDTQAERVRVGEEWGDSIKKRIPYRANYTLRNGAQIETTADPVRTETGEVIGFRGTLWATDVSGHAIGPKSPAMAL